MADSLPTRSTGATTGRADSVLQFHTLTEAQRRELVAAAAQWVTAAVLGRPMDPPDGVLGPLAKETVMGAFVTLKRGDLLRGCCGVLGQPMRLGEAVAEAARKTVREDKRMAAVALGELPYLSISITLLGPARRVRVKGHQRMEAVEVGRHGLIIQRGKQTGLLLPSVAVERGWNAERFLEAVCEKAGLPIGAWEGDDTNLFVFEGYSIDGAVANYLPEDLPSRKNPPLSDEQLAEYARVAGENIVALATGGTPSYVVPHLPDLTVHALVLSLQWMASENKETQQANAVQVSIRPGIPLQATLYQMCQQTAVMFQRQGFVGELRVGLTIGTEPCMHGFGLEADLEGVDSGYRSVMIADANHCGFAFDPQRSARELLDELHRRLPIGSRDAAVHTMEVQSTMPRVVSVSGPTPVARQGTRPPAVAGKFYPAQDAARREMVQRLLQGPSPHRLQPLAAMVPHAGLKYSGKIAADVWRRIDGLDGRTLVIIGPKHTRHGINWAVCPCTQWSLSQAVAFDNDFELMQTLAAKVTPLQLDAAAHAQEHGIEVQLPFLEFLGPQCKVVGLALAGASWPDIRAAAAELAEVLRDLHPRPLLVISSDMNHYAPDAENRRRDRLALDALATGDPQHLIEVCQQHEISMCGVVPAALVMQTLHDLEESFQVVEIGYATSADVTGQRGQVVGYAGCLFLPTG
ncbi:MAG: hypothetical protein KatS3mg111_0445 [Pirellulaceae bacterium]|nr:MAG: hypothetical protein KatS3mg111_0445 [Pirellulaceae bacterium]